MGPIGLVMEPYGSFSKKEAREIFLQQAKILLDSGVDLFALETFHNIDEFREAFLAIKKLSSSIPVICYLTVGLNKKTSFGTPVIDAFRELVTWGIDIFGLNCSVGPQPMLGLLKRAKKNTLNSNRFKPNAGLPRLVDGRNLYMCSPEYMAHFCKEAIISGAKFIGGCCGTSPKHIKAMSEVMSYGVSINLPKPELNIETAQEKCEEKGLEPVELAKKSMWSKRIAEGDTVYSVEILLPNCLDCSLVIEKSRQLKNKGIHAINIPDGPRS